MPYIPPSQRRQTTAPAASTNTNSAYVPPSQRRQTLPTTTTATEPVTSTIPTGLSEQEYRLSEEYRALPYSKKYWAVQPREMMAAENKRKNLETAQSKLGAFGLGAANSATLGATKQILSAGKNYTGMGNADVFQAAQAAHPIAYGAGTMAGYVAPGIGSLKLTKPLTSLATKGIANVLGKKVVEGAIAGAAVDTAQGLIERDKPLDLLKRVGIGATIGAVADVGLYGAGKLINKAKPKTIADQVLKATSETLPSEKAVSQTLKTAKQLKAEADALITRAKTTLGTTVNPNEAGYILPDGTMLDFSGKRAGGEPNVRNMDHRDIAEIYTDKQQTAAMNDFMINTNATRVSFNEKSAIIDITGTTPLTAQQKSAIIKSAQRHESVMIDYYKDAKTASPTYSANLDMPLANDLSKELNKIELMKESSKQVNSVLPMPSNKVVLESTKAKPTFMTALQTFYRRIVNTQSPLARFSKQTGDNTAMLASNTRNTGGTVDYILKDALVDMDAKKVGSSLKEVVEGIPAGKEQRFWDYMSQRHNIDRAREGKNVIANYTSEMSQKAAFVAEQADPEFKKIGDDVTKWIDDFMQEWGVKSGIVDKDVYAELRKTYKSYFPTQREFSQLEKSMPEGFTKRFIDQATPLKKATGSARDINNPIENIMSLVNRTVKTARYNTVGQSLLDSVRKAPDKLKQLAEVIPAKQGMFSNVDNIVTVLENGKPVYLQINDKALLDSLNGLPKIINNAQIARKFSKVYKGLITQKNPLFAVRNIARDIPTAYIYGSEHNPIKFGVNLAKAGKEILTNGEMYQKYKAMGGGQSGFFAPAKAEQAAKELTKGGGFHPLKAIENFNAVTEQAPRLAEFTTIYNKTGNIQKALAAANDVTVNFARGGDVTKSIEPFVPYLNAGVQGLDKFFRQFKNKPLQTLAKGGVAITLPEVGFYLINKDNPHYQELDNRTKDTYNLIPNIFDKDDEGNAKTFIKIPKSRELGVLFGSLFQRIFRAAEGEKDAFKGFGGTVATNFAPTNPIENNIIAPIYNLKSNKDFAGRTIVPLGMQMDNRSDYLQYDEKTTEIAKLIGKKIAEITGGDGVSPKQIDYIVKSYTGVIGQLGLPAATKGGSILKPITTNFISDPLYSNQTISNFYDNLNELQQKAADRNIIENIPSEAVTPEEAQRNLFTKYSDQISVITKQINKLDQSKDEAKIRELRQKIIDVAKKANSMIK